MSTCLAEPQTRDQALTSQSQTRDPATETEAPHPTEHVVDAEIQPGQPPRKFRLVRFLYGLLLSGVGMAIILLIGVGLLYVRRMDRELALPLVALAVILGVMFVGGGFGLMATASSGFDEAEFQRSLSGRPLRSIPADDPRFPQSGVPDNPADAS